VRGATSDGCADALLDRATATQWTRNMLQREFDESLSAQGFTRSAKATAYVRAVPSGTQRLDFTLLMRPNWAKDAVVLSLTHLATDARDRRVSGRRRIAR
jgi:hypothetical protein